MADADGFETVHPLPFTRLCNIKFDWWNVGDMTAQEITAFLEKVYPGQKVKFLGHGSDSMAFRVDGRVFRFSDKDISIYAKEAAVCQFLRDYITCEIPDIEIVSRDGFQYAVHKMLTGDAWSWHKFSFSPARQRNLARSAARFLGQLHGVNTDDLIRAVPAVRDSVPYIDFDLVEPYLARFMTAHQMRRFRRIYNQIVNAPVNPTDMVLVHLGLKGANSVIFPDGNLKGVFDFGNCGIYERGRDLVLFSLSRNRRLYNEFLREYQKVTGVRISRRRIRDLALVEFLWAKRWYVDGVFTPLGPRATRRNVCMVLMRFYHLPEFMKPVVRLFMKMHERIAK